MHLEEIRSKKIYIPLANLPDNLELWTEELLKPLGTEIRALVFRSNDKESRYYGRTWVYASTDIKQPAHERPLFKEPFYAYEAKEPWGDFGEALLKA